MAVIVSSLHFCYSWARKFALEKCTQCEVTVVGGYTRLVDRSSMSPRNISGNVLHIWTTAIKCSLCSSFYCRDPSVHFATFYEHCTCCTSSAIVKIDLTGCMTYIVSYFQYKVCWLGLSVTSAPVVSLYLQLERERHLLQLKIIH